MNVAALGELHADEDGHRRVCLKDSRKTQLAFADRAPAFTQRLGGM